MNRLSKLFASLLKVLFFKSIKGNNRLIYNIAGLFFIAVFHLTVSVVLFFWLHASIIKTDKVFEADLKLAHSIKTDLVILSSQLDFSTPTLNRLVNQVDMLSFNCRAERSWKLTKASLTNMIELASGSKKNGAHNQEIDDGIIKSQVLIDDLIRILMEKREAARYKLLSKATIYETSAILIIVLLVCVGAFLLTKSLKEQQSEVAYFESLAYQFKGGQLDKIQFNYRGKILTTLNQVISSYIQQLKERYRAVKEEIKKINFQLNEISLFSKQNISFYNEIKRGLEQTIEQNHDQIDKYRELDEQIKSLDLQLEGSQQQIFELHESVKNKARVFHEAPEGIKEIEIRINKREEYLKKVVSDLYQLRSALERLLQTGSIFQNVAEQNVLLALNASIEAARAEGSAGGFDIAAEEIANLAVKIGRVSKELLAVVDTMSVKGNAALKTLEIDLARNNEVKHFIEGVSTKITIFCLKLSQLLEETIQYSIQIEELEDRRRTLGELASSLGDINQKSQTNFGRAEAALEVIKKSGENLSVTEQLDSLMAELKHLMNKITI
ncbi:MAG: methyl-accepting chemotaxis protein [Bacteroidota bacterium]